MPHPPYAHPHTNPLPLAPPPQLVNSAVAPALGLGTLGGQQAAASAQLSALMASLGTGSQQGQQQGVEAPNAQQVAQLLQALQAAAKQGGSDGAPQAPHQVVSPKASAQPVVSQPPGPDALRRADTIRLTVGQGALEDRGGRSEKNFTCSGGSCVP